MALLRGVSDTWLQFDWHFCRSGPEHLFMCFMDIWMPSLEKCPFRFLPVFLLGWLFFWSWAVGGFPCGSAGKESTCNAGHLGLIPGLEPSPGEEKGYPIQYSGLENSMDCIVHGVTKSRTRLNDFHCHYSLVSLIFWIHGFVLMLVRLGYFLPLNQPEIKPLNSPWTAQRPVGDAWF